MWWYRWRQLCLILCLIERSSELPRRSSEVFGNLRKILENVQKVSYVLRTTLWKTSIGGRNSSENRQKLRSWYVYKTNKIIHDARIFLLVFNSISQEFANPTREIWSLACEQTPEWGYASEASCERKHLMTSSTLDDERSTRLRTGPVRSGPVHSWRYFCVFKARTRYKPDNHANGVSN